MAKKVDESVEKNTWGFGVNDAPVWFYKELVKEANEIWGGKYWAALVDWYRKAKEFENCARGGLPAPQLPQPNEIESGDKDEKVKTLG